MAVKRMDNVGIVFEDLPKAISFFKELGLELEGEMLVDGDWAARIVGLPGQQVDIAMMQVPGSNSRLELMSFRQPKAIKPEPQNAPANTLGIRRLMFAVDNIEDTISRLTKHGASLIGEVVNYENVYLLCYLRGPEGVIIALAEELK